MTKPIQVTSEVVRLTQKTAELHSLPFHKQVARCLVEQAIMELDPELNFLLDSDAALSSLNAVVRNTQANDVVVNGRHIDVRVLEGNEVKLSAALAGTPYIECGSLVLELGDTGRGVIAGYIEPKRWESASQYADSNDISLPFQPDKDFDLAACLKKIEETHPASVDKEPAVQPKTEDILRFVRNPKELKIEGQRAVIAAALHSQRIRENIEALDKFSTDRSPRILRDASAWEARVQRIADKISEKFPQLPREKVIATARQIGEQFGGQTEAPAYKEALAKAIARQHLVNRVSSRAKKLMDPLIDGVAAGKNAGDTIKGMLKNAVAVDLAAIIQKKRADVQHFTQLTAQEIGFAFQQLQLQPAYATHSQEETTGVDAINEALELYEAASVVEGLLNIDFD